jgi:hypothetical protein
VVIATAEPYQRGWEAEMKPILRKDIRRVISQSGRHHALPGRVLQPGEIGQGRDEQG